ncbi:o-succinylbenzoate--CoA ligase [Bacillus sp. SM2101]|uniref:o-succinylbenzoate--CoA ligase n=1 Tax=Bacillus sp. SM2101 TaxID=2805366 RepID=UPI001BDDFA3B|nr:o-succinylbenzoate--CoA ligase [Bacillus sp. SM2101]
MQQVIPNFLLQRAKLTPNRIAVTYHKEQITFLNLHERAITKARKLHSFGVKKDDTVAILMNNSIEFIEIIHALKHIGAITVFLNTRLTEAEITWQIVDARVDYFITEDAFSNISKGIANENPLLNIVSVKQLDRLQETEFSLIEEFPLHEIDTIMYTSGTTGKPKGVIQTYGNHWWSAVGSALNLGLHEKDRWLLAVPIFHISGLSILMRSVIYGMTVILHDRFIPSQINQSITRDGATIVSVVAVMLQKMIDELEDHSYPPYFRCMLTGGGPVPTPLLKKCKERAIPVFQTYGMTETASQIVTLTPEDSLNKVGSAGKPLFPAQVRIEKDGDIVAANETGEIVVKGPNVTSGYLFQEEITRKAIINDWFYTGDIGYIDDDGFLYVLDRRSDLIISGGENIYPAEIESVLLSHQDIDEAGVIGVFDKTWGQVPCAFIKCKNDVDVSESELIQYCSTRLAKYKVPNKIVFVQELPRNASNKLLRRKLYEYIRN